MLHKRRMFFNSSFHWWIKTHNSLGPDFWSISKHHWRAQVEHPSPSSGMGSGTPSSPSAQVEHPSPSSGLGSGTPSSPRSQHTHHLLVGSGAPPSSAQRGMIIHRWLRRKDTRRAAWNSQLYKTIISTAVSLYYQDMKLTSVNFCILVIFHLKFCLGG
jgi:hypothetical protein